LGEKIAVSPHCSTPEKSKLHPEQYTKHIHFKTDIIQSPETHNKTNHRKNTLKTRISSSPYLEIS